MKKIKIERQPKTCRIQVDTLAQIDVLSKKLNLLPSSVRSLAIEFAMTEKNKEFKKYLSGNPLATPLGLMKEYIEE